MDCQTVWKPGGGDSSSSPSKAESEWGPLRGPKSIMVGGQATAYSQPSQLDMRLCLPTELLIGDPFLGLATAATTGAKTGEDAAVVAPEGRWREVTVE